MDFTTPIIEVVVWTIVAFVGLMLIRRYGPWVQTWWPRKLTLWIAISGCIYSMVDIGSHVFSDYTASNNIWPFVLIKMALLLATVGLVFDALRRN
jgi:NADH:ubiquinone oxidoreductase subunit 6 (subunit J)